MLEKLLCDARFWASYSLGDVGDDRELFTIEPT